MLILFDLDDTLIETSKCLTKPALKKALEAMVEKGLKLSSAEKAYGTLLDINANSLTSRDALELFWRQVSNQKNILDAGVQALSTPLSEEIELEPVPGALELLDELQASHTLALVTSGHSDFQLQKMEKAGIQPAKFSKLVISDRSSKKLDYQNVLTELRVSPQEALVCGDRVPLDLVPAKELGLYTVHFRNGRGKVCFEPIEYVDQVITRLNELHEVFAKL